MKYRVFIGSYDEGDPDYVSVDQQGLTWNAAKKLMSHYLRNFKDDTCNTCREQAAEELRRLLNTKPGSFKAFVDGDDYLIMVEQ